MQLQAVIQVDIQALHHGHLSTAPWAMCSEDALTATAQKENLGTKHRMIQKKLL